MNTKTKILQKIFESVGSEWNEEKLTSIENWESIFEQFFMLNKKFAQNIQS